MNIESFDFIRYLAAKKTVDDRALNRLVLKSMSHSLKKRSIEQKSILNVLEIASGIGTMLERLIEWDLIPNVHYKMVDIRPKYIAQAKIRIREWAESKAFEVTFCGNDHITIATSNQKFEVSFEIADIVDFFDYNHEMFDLVIAHAFLDFANVESLLPKMFSVLKKNGLFYFSINFDGETILLPEIDSNLDKNIIEEYHNIMDQQKIQDGFVAGTKVGRKLFTYIQKAGAKILNAGSSDWVVFPQDKKYLYQEDYFLHCIIDTIAETLRGQTSYDIASWIAQRHEQIAQCELTYIAHQLDFFGTYNSI